MAVLLDAAGRAFTSPGGIVRVGPGGAAACGCCGAPPDALYVELLACADQPGTVCGCRAGAVSEVLYAPEPVRDSGGNVLPVGATVIARPNGLGQDAAWCYTVQNQPGAPRFRLDEIQPALIAGPLSAPLSGCNDPACPRGARLCRAIECGCSFGDGRVVLVCSDAVRSTHGPFSRHFCGPVTCARYEQGACDDLPLSTILLDAWPEQDPAPGWSCCDACPSGQAGQCGGKFDQDWCGFTNPNQPFCTGASTLGVSLFPAWPNRLSCCCDARPGDIATYDILSRIDWLVDNGNPGIGSWTWRAAGTCRRGQMITVEVTQTTPGGSNYTEQLPCPICPNSGIIGGAYAGIQYCNLPFNPGSGSLASVDVSGTIRKRCDGWDIDTVALEQWNGQATRRNTNRSTVTWGRPAESGYPVFNSICHGGCGGRDALRLCPGAQALLLGHGGGRGGGGGGGGRGRIVVPDAAGLLAALSLAGAGGGGGGRGEEARGGCGGCGGSALGGGVSPAELAWMLREGA